MKSSPTCLVFVAWAFLGLFGDDPGVFLGRARADGPSPPDPMVAVDTTEVPDLDAWGRKAKDLVEEWYPKLVRELSSPTYRPPRTIRLVFKKDMKGVAATSGTRIQIAARWVTDHPDDLGMVIHELVHVVQSYPPRGHGWLVEGIADYIRFWRFEPQAPRPKIDPNRSKVRDGYRTTAAFLAWVEATYDAQVVRKLNQALREARYEDGLFKEFTGKDLDELEREFLRSRRGPREGRDAGRLDEGNGERGGRHSPSSTPSASGPSFAPMSAVAIGLRSPWRRQCDVVLGWVDPRG